ncbi:type I-C CRISPR-associated protein Cas5c [Candidatus Magnetominusculus xianensis]|uniref:pre-crRNA processing endonuclease n=1 Tax=Candidatus Magnetominusculus xianensis TaxID=1748249 RepID=A0ABR5SDU4_9BACT|nr:type I-C CRISPR-associated protein Cas5c [Candidatus Magnetominusculus xianensis]KWT83494.1 CRISPR-associated protein Cas5 [Candidatus Magnetominusculus xianensis]MBF0404134.1 type I-C CRISPR-associated protein Cas5 [Nitrospirota bacterium]
MVKPNIVEFKVEGKYALFTDPLTKLGGEKCSYHIPTYEALKGILSSVYWKPTFTWVIDELRVMKRIKTQTRASKPIIYSGQGHSLAIYTYLSDVEYQVRAHFEWNMNRQDMAGDRCENKHHEVAKRMIEKGGRRDIFLGARECQGYVTPCSFGEGRGDYDDYGEISFGMMFHGFDYPDEIGSNEFYARLWQPKMNDGKVHFIRPDKCTIKRLVRPMKANPPKSVGLNEEGLLDELDTKTL